MRGLAVTIAGIVMAGCASTGADAPADALTAAVDHACGAQVVFLGEEPSHGGGRTLEVKADLVTELMQRCGFTHVAFEGQIYDFIDLEEKHAAGAATREALYDAIGGLWSRAAQIDPLVNLLHSLAAAGGIRLSGFDINANGATSFHAQNHLAARLVQPLPEAARKRCGEVLARLLAWKFTPEHPKDAAFDAAALECARDAERSAAAGGADAVQLQMARSFRALLEMKTAADRERAMAENLRWLLSRLPAGTKTIVWTANTHALRAPLDGWESMASLLAAQLDVPMKSIAIVAAGGARSDGAVRIAPISTAAPGSLEAQVSSSAAPLSWASGSTLRGVGAARSRILGYAGYRVAPWHELFDGVLVVSAEVPQVFSRPAKPLQEP